MPELLVRSAANLAPLPRDPLAAAAMFRAGDILSWGVDGFGWSAEERSSGVFVLVASSDMSLGQAADLCAPLPPDTSGATVPSIASHRVDLSKLPAAGTDGKVHIAAADLLAATSANPYFPAS